MHNCPSCDKLTEGTPTEGGLTWIICPDCFQQKNNLDDDKNDMNIESFPESIQCGNCGTWRNINSEGVVQQCHYCEDDEFYVFEEIEI